ncbi:MAG: hypothetical protein ACE5HQ_01460 [Gemmatimonadota bacterium]
MKRDVWALEWRIAMRRRRLLLWNVGVPLGLLGPVALSSAPEAHRAVVFTLFIVFFGAFGSCVPLVRDADSGWTEKILLTGYGERRWLGERLLAASCLDTLQLLPAMLLLFLAEGLRPAGAVAALAAMSLALLSANVLGALVAAVVRSLAEGALACAATALFALHMAGVFRVPERHTWAWAAKAVSPFGPLHEAMGQVAGGWGESFRGASRAWLPGLAGGLVLTGIALLLAPLLARRLTGR